MEENSKNIQISHTSNLNPLNFNTTLNIGIDSNANIKTVLDINSYIYDQKVECGNGKAIITGKIGVKVLYVDTDNITNTVTDSVGFTETYQDNSLTSSTFLDIFNYHIINNILSVDSSLKINFDVSIHPVSHTNLGISNNLSLTDGVITKKKEIKTTSISEYINSQCEYTTNFETKDTITKILCNNSYLSVEKVVAENGYAVLEGKINSSVVYETQKDDNTQIKEIKEAFNFKCDLEISNLMNDNILDLSFCLDKNREETALEIEDNISVITTKHFVKACGVCLKQISIDVVDDMFSPEFEIETTSSARECTNNVEQFSVSEVVSNETTLSDEETAIDEIVANLSIQPEITNKYVKDNYLFVEGIVSSCLVYVDENKEYKLKTIEIPFIINTKHQSQNSDNVHCNICVLDNKVKVKRGTIIEAEYSILINFTMFSKENHNMIDSFKIGKTLDFGNYDYQIYLAKPEETIWELCKRIKVSPTEIGKYNKDLPLICSGGEKIIVKR